MIEFFSLSYQVIALLLKYRKRGEKQSLQRLIKDYQKELKTISQTDEFAKYSKLQRKLRASTDQYNGLAREDFELNFKYGLIGQGLAWLLAVIFSFRFVYQLYALALDYLGYGYNREEKVGY